MISAVNLAFIHIQTNILEGSNDRDDAHHQTEKVHFNVVPMPIGKRCKLQKEICKNNNNNNVFHSEKHTPMNIPH